MSRDLHASVAAMLATDEQRYTRGRRCLIEALAAAGRPLTIADILAAAPSLPQSSAYRNLAVLEEAGVVNRLVTNEEFARYELTEELTVHHHHLVCMACGAVEDIDIPKALERSLEKAVTEIASDSDFTGVSHRLDLMGCCPDCA
jgi:Fur family ferric uptake transcriptional regulator